tara:strand:- start:83 stop:322 length:240 start_codon:yes stop_codon:yes gene_type:complete
MKHDKVKINWPDGKTSICNHGEDWLVAAIEANIVIPTGCLGGSCGACEIEVNGEVVRACINKIPSQNEIIVEFFSDPYW